VAVAMLLLVVRHDSPSQVDLDSISPFGGVEDETLPMQLGSPPRLEHLMYSNYGPGYNDNGQLRSRSGRLQAGARKFMAAAAPSPRPAPRRAAGRLVEGQQAQMLPRSSTDSRALLLSASLKYLDALRRFQAADGDAAVGHWVATRNRWLATSRAAPSRHVVQSEQKQILASEEKEHQDVEAGQKDYLEALALFAQANGQEGLDERWKMAQAGWDYFYETNRLLDARQEKLDHQRAEILENFLPRNSRKTAVKVDEYIPMWQPFRSCGSSEDSALCSAASKLAPPPPAVGFVAVKSLEGQQLASQQKKVPQRAQASKEGGVQQELDKAFARSNEMQKRINRARFLLYLREFGPIPELFEQTKTSSLYYPGDFEMPRVTDCDVPGSCHDWANGAYIDGFAAATTNWDMMGQPTPGYLHWDSIADDAWKGGYDTMPGGGAVSWKARTTSLAQSSPMVDWKAFNEKEARMEQQAKEAADMLMSTDLQDLPTQRLFVTADPSLPQQLQDRKAAVGGAGTWVETHGEGGNALPSSPSDYLQDWHPPAGLPFGGNIASKPVPARRRSGRRQQQLQRSLRRVQHLMDQQWKGRVDSLRSPMEEQQQRREANAAARRVEEAADRKFGLTPSGGSDVERLQGSARKRELNKEIHAAVLSIDQALKPPSYAGPSSSSEEEEGGGRRGREANRGGGSSLFRSEKIRLPRGERAGAKPKVERLLSDLRKEQVKNRLLQKKLRKAEEQGFGASYQRKLEQSERGVASVVASKLAPEVVKEAAMLVAKDIEKDGKTRTRRERAAEGASARSSARSAYEGVEGVYDDAPRYRSDMRGSHFPLAGASRMRYPVEPLEPGAREERRRKEYPADEDYDEETRAVAKRCHDHPGECVGDEMEIAHMWERRRAGFARGLYNETEEERGQRRRMRRYSRGLNVTGYSEDDEPWNLRGGESTVSVGIKEFAPHYFNHAFWSQLVHYFKRDKPTQFCNVCVGEFMTGLHDLNLRHVPASEVPVTCQGVCESNQALGFKFARRVKSAGEEEATWRRQRLLRHIATVVNSRSRRNDAAALQAPSQAADYRPADILPTSQAAEAEAVRRELRTEQKLQRREQKELRKQLKLHEKLERDNAIVGMADKGRTTSLAEAGGAKWKKMEKEGNEVFNGGFQ